MGLKTLVVWRNNTVYAFFLIYLNVNHRFSDCLAPISVLTLSDLACFYIITCLHITPVASAPAGSSSLSRLAGCWSDFSAFLHLFSELLIPLVQRNYFYNWKKQIGAQTFIAGVQQLSNRIHFTIMTRSYVWLVNFDNRCFSNISLAAITL